MKWLDQTKECRTCGAEKPMRDYYEHPQMPDGHLNHCKECVKARVREHRQKNLERIQEYDRQRALLPHRKEAVKKRAHKYVEKQAARVREYRERNPEVRRAHSAVNNAIRAGKLEAQPCERCGYAVGVHAHHEDYSRPLDVTWLCKRCHGERHREINEERRRSVA